MTTTPAESELDELVRSVGLGWRLDRFGPVDQGIAHLHRRLQAGDVVARTRFPDGTIRLTVDSVASLAGRSAEKARAFVEQLFGQGSSEMLVMAWRVINGADIGSVRLDLDQASRFRLQIMLRPDRNGTEENYESDDVCDIYLLRQFGIAKLNGHLPVLVGFYPTWRLNSQTSE